MIPGNDKESYFKEGTILRFRMRGILPYKDLRALRLNQRIAEA
jgi:hypothetical protein